MMYSIDFSFVSQTAPLCLHPVFILFCIRLHYLFVGFLYYFAMLTVVVSLSFHFVSQTFAFWFQSVFILCCIRLHSYLSNVCMKLSLGLHFVLQMVAVCFTFAFLSFCISLWNDFLELGKRYAWGFIPLWKHLQFVCP